MSSYLGGRPAVPDVPHTVAPSGRRPLGRAASYLVAPPRLRHTAGGPQPERASPKPPSDNPARARRYAKSNRLRRIMTTPTAEASRLFRGEDLYVRWLVIRWKHFVLRRFVVRRKYLTTLATTDCGRSLRRPFGHRDLLSLEDFGPLKPANTSDRRHPLVAVRSRSDRHQRRAPHRARNSPHRSRGRQSSPRSPRDLPVAQRGRVRPADRAPLP